MGADSLDPNPGAGTATGHLFDKIEIAIEVLTMCEYMLVAEPTDF
jgi:hypothetical protein